ADECILSLEPPVPPVADPTDNGA
ncbi:MAG: hypothetical protein QOD81_2917, partial [Solirubrobacteraceae bacterium]|nr:hypothetical protein [Solirubrobacteraceae bacterium]